MHLWIIYSKIVLNPQKNNAISWMLDEAKLLHLDAKIIFAEDLYLGVDHTGFVLYHLGHPITPPDVAFIRCYDIAMIEHLERMGVKTYNNSTSMATCLDKWHTHQVLASNHLPSPKTLYSLYTLTFESIAEELGSPFVMKDTKGARGEQVFLIHHHEDYQSALLKCNHPLFQEYIKTSFGKDIRIHVVGDQVVASVLRVSKSDFKSNFSQGGDAFFYDLDDEAKNLAIASTKALGLNFSGVDLLFTDGGYLICEVNGVPGFRTVGLTSQVSLPNKMLSYIKEQL